MYEIIKDTCYIWAKEMRSVISDEGVLIFFVVVPLLYPLLYSWAYNNEVVRDVPVAVVDLSNSNTSRQFIRRCDASPEVKVAYRCSSIDEARRLVGHQVARGIVYFPSDFEKNLGRGEQSKISLFCDMSMMLTYKAIYLTTMNVAQDMNAEIQVAQANPATEREGEILTKPLDFEEVQMFNTPAGYGNFILPGVLVLILQQTLLLGIGLGAGTARENNRYQDLVPVSRHYKGFFRIVFGKALCYFMVFAVMCAYITLVVPRIFSFTSIPQPGVLFALMLPYLLACIFFGMFFSCIIRYRENVILLVVFLSLPFLFLAGLSWPQTSIPAALQGIAHLVPSTFGIRGFVRVSVMGATLDDVRYEYVWLWVLTAVYFLATCAVYRYQLRSARRHAVERVTSIKEAAVRQKAINIQKEANT
ncbi:MAG: ABC transporter permease [Prevotella sp.]|uniref:ABC transporter permease n=1 Tax=Prevotella sp. TaxID=59823 RepID=UPI002A351969|nr:ABC transporter permease [Prevotella sp.]MDD7318500.1 ABC transporter permease [Prevotellaceae bacterium]MDY4020305.1 ABC transporter permease [Prevotella sp.]